MTGSGGAPTVEGAGSGLALRVDGRRLRFPAIWLRDNCPCDQCVAPGTAQKLHDITDLPNGLADLPEMSWSRYLAGDQAGALEAVLRLGRP